MLENYTYPIKVEENPNGGYDIHYVDFDDMPVGHVESKGMIVYAAQKTLALKIIDYLDANKPLPESTYEVTDGCTYINVWLPQYRKPIKYVKKNCTIPDWINDLACRNDINFSATLVEALKEKLGIHR